MKKRNEKSIYDFFTEKELALEYIKLEDKLIEVFKINSVIFLGICGGIYTSLSIGLNRDIIIGIFLFTVFILTYLCKILLNFDERFKKIEDRLKISKEEKRGSKLCYDIRTFGLIIFGIIVCFSVINLVLPLFLVK